MVIHLFLNLIHGGVEDLRRRGGGAGEGERRLLAGGGEGLLLRLPRGEASFWRFRGDGEALWEGECLRRLPTSPFFTWDLLGRSSSEEEEEPESDEDCWFCRLYSVSSSTSSLTFPKKILSSNTEEILSFSTSKEKNGFAPSPSQTKGITISTTKASGLPFTTSQTKKPPSHQETFAFIVIKA